VLAARSILLSVPELDEPELVAWHNDVDNQNRLALSLTSVATVAFLWFIALIRRRRGDREDQFFSTAFIWSGLVLTVARLLATSAAVSPAIGSRLLDSNSLNATVIAGRSRGRRLRHRLINSVVAGSSRLLSSLQSDPQVDGDVSAELIAQGIGETVGAR